jgi:hypothetical protein
MLLIASVATALAPVRALAAPPPPADAPIIYLANDRPDDEHGPVKLAKRRATATGTIPNGIIVTTFYDEICTEPCGVPVDTTERPLFFLVRDGTAVSGAFRLHRFSGPTTLRWKPGRGGLAIAGVLLTAFLILPAGIPMLVASRSKLRVASGPPSEGQRFEKMKWAK